MKRLLLVALILITLVLPSVTSAEAFFSLPVATIILDAGHGGKDPGAVGKITEGEQSIDIYEKEINLQLVKLIGTNLEELYPGIEVIYTRNGDDYISLWERTQIANSHPYTPDSSKLFVSIHVNAAGTESASGFEIWRLQKSIEKDFFTTSLSESGVLSMTETLNTTLNGELDAMTTRLSQSIETSLQYNLPVGVKDRGIKEGSFYVLHNSCMPAVLIETGFMTNEDEIRRLIDPIYQQRLSEGVAIGIITYLESLIIE